MTRPTCVCCGEPYGKRHTKMERLYWPKGQDRPPYRGNRIVVKEWDGYTTTSRSMLMATAAKEKNPALRAMEEAKAAKAPEEAVNVASRETWDGETWTGGYDPFCTLRCALHYARHAYAQRRAASK